MIQASTSGRPALLDVANLKTHLFTRRGVVRAVDGISFSLAAGETMALVGESGCGKTMACLSILRLVPEPAARIVSGRILFRGDDLLKKGESEMRRLRGKSISMILQDPMTSLNPLFTIAEQVGAPLRQHCGTRGGLLRDKVVDLLRLVRIPSPEKRLSDYPHQMSGGMRQRVAGAIGLSCVPELLIADEPTTSLDATIQAQYLDLLKELQREFGVALIIVTHDFGVVARMCDRAAVMYSGRILEIGKVRELFDNPLHPYSDALLRCRPKLGRKSRRLVTIEGQPPSLLNPPSGCCFRARCDQIGSYCKSEEPPLVELSDDHSVRCWKRVL